MCILREQVEGRDGMYDRKIEGKGMQEKNEQGTKRVLEKEPCYW